MVRLNLCAKGCIYEEIFRVTYKVWFEVPHNIGVRVSDGYAERFLTDYDSVFHEIMFSFLLYFMQEEFFTFAFSGSE